MQGKKGHQGLVAGKEPNVPEGPGPEMAEMAKKHFNKVQGNHDPHFSPPPLF